MARTIRAFATSGVIVVMDPTQNLNDPLITTAPGVQPLVDKKMRLPGYRGLMVTNVGGIDEFYTKTVDKKLQPKF